MSVLTLSQAISIIIFPARHAAYVQCLLLIKVVTFFCVFVVWEAIGASKWAGMKK